MKRDNNPADAMTKVSLNKALSRLIERNELTVRVDGYVERPKKKVDNEEWE